MADETIEARVFDVETRFQQLAKRPGALPRDKAIEEAVASIEEKKPGFDEWVLMEMQGLAAAIDTARTGATPDKWVERANVHSRNLRDVGTTMGAELMTFVADALCEVLDGIEAGLPYDLDTLICYFDALILVRQPNYRGVSPDQVPELTRGLRRIADRFSIAPE
jgi:hypothetical protein